METQQELSKQSFPESAPDDIFQGKDEEGQADLREGTCAIPAFKGRRERSSWEGVRSADRKPQYKAR